MSRLKDKLAIVTGGGGGIGGAIATRFAEEGATVIVADIDESRAERIAGDCRRYTDASEAVVCDVARSASVDAMFASVAAQHRRVDVLVTTAGISSAQDRRRGGASGGEPTYAVPVATTTDESWHRMLGVHLDGTFFCIRAALRSMTGGGSIVCTSSIAGLAGVGPFHYAAAKGGILGLVRSLARDLGPTGIRINAICPGAIDAGMTLEHDPAVVAAYVPMVPLRRLGTAAEVANAALYLASDESSYTTGQWLSPNGGSIIA